MAFPCVNPNLTEFVDRTDELNFLLKKISFPTYQGNGEEPLSSDERVVHLIGNSNVGKSLLLCKCHNHIIDLENTKTVSVTLSFKDYLDFSGDQFAIQVLDFLHNRIAFFLGIQPPNNVGKSLKERSSMFLKELETLQKKKNVAFLMDEVSLLASEQITALEDYFFAQCLNLSNTVFILTGRRIVTGWKDFALRPISRNVLVLTGFDFDKTREQINKVNPLANEHAHKIHEFSGGSPGKNKEILSLFINAQPWIVDLEVAHTCNRELYEALDVAGQRLPGNVAAELLPSLEALCILQDFDKDYEMPVLLQAHHGLTGVWDGRRSSLLLNHLSGIHVGPGLVVDWDRNASAFSVEKQIKFSLEQELKIRDKDLWKVLHFTAIKMYSKWAKEYASDIFTQKYLYHKSVLRKNVVETLNNQ